VKVFLLGFLKIYITLQVFLLLTVLPKMLLLYKVKVLSLILTNV
jgi:hypothetical protein